MTIKQETAITKVIENHGNVSKAMLEAGYSPASAKNPSNLTRSKAYIKAMEALKKKHGVTLEKYVRNVGEAMDATDKVEAGKKIVGKGKDKVVETVYKDVPNISLRLQGNKQAEKLLGIDKITEEANSSNLSPEEMKQLASESDEMTLTQLVFKKQTD